MNELQVNDLKTMLIDDEIWFIGGDICKLIGVHKCQLRRLDEDEKIKHRVKSGRGMQMTTLVNESGLYHLVLTAQSDTAKAFRKLITRDFLPKVRAFYNYKPENIAQFIEDSGNKKLSMFEKRALSAIMSED